MKREEDKKIEEEERGRGGKEKEERKREEQEKEVEEEERKRKEKEKEKERKRSSSNSSGLLCLPYFEVKIFSAQQIFSSQHVSLTWKLGKPVSKQFSWDSLQQHGWETNSKYSPLKPQPVAKNSISEKTQLLQSMWLSYMQKNIWRKMKSNVKFVLYQLFAESL